MRRVWAIFAIRILVSRPSLRLYALGFLLWRTAVIVSVRDVFANMPNIAHVDRLFGFAVNAFLHTEFLAQTLLSGIILIGSFSLWRTLLYVRRNGLSFVTPVRPA